MKEVFKHDFKTYRQNILAGVSAGIVVGLIANAILGQVFQILYDKTDWNIWHLLWQTMYAIQFTVPLLIGSLIALNFGFKGIEMACISVATFVGSGVVKYQADVRSWSISGTGDLFNVMITAFFAVVLIDYFKDKLGSLTIVLLPIIGGFAGFLGLLTLPFVSNITNTLGQMINHFTNMQKFIMCILIAVAFAILIITPVSTVAIGLAVGLNGLAAGSAALGVAACTAVLTIGSIKAKNEKGVTIAILMGAMKMMIPNLIQYPILLLPVITTSIFTGFFGALINITGTPQTAGFGLVGLVGPIGAFKGLTTVNSPLSKVFLIFMAFFVVTFGAAYLCDFIFRKCLKLYDLTIYENNGGM